jgi:hypothetical protein
MYRVLNVVFTLTINGHNDKVKQSEIFLLPPYPHPTVFYNHPVETCLQEVPCWLVQYVQHTCLAGSYLYPTK